MNIPSATAGRLRGRHYLALTMLAIAGLLAACGGSGAAASDSSANGKQPIVIGTDEDSTGPAAPYATVTGATIRDAIAQINDHGGIAGHHVKLIVGNDESDPTKAPSVVRKLISKGADALIMNSGSQSAIQVKSIVKQAKVPMIAPTNLTATIAKPPDNEYAYILANSAGDIGTVYAHAFPKAGIHRVGVLEEDSSAIAGIDKQLLPKLKKAGITIVATEKMSTDATSVTAQVARLKKANPDAVFVTSLGGKLEVLADNTLAKQTPKLPVFSLASIGNQPDIWKQADPGALNGVTYVASISPKNKHSNQLEQFLEKRRGDKFTTLTAYDAQGYDAVQLFKTAMKRAAKSGKIDGESINKQLQTIHDFPASFGQSGFTLSFSTKKHIGTDGLCGLLLRQFGKDNKPGQLRPGYQPKCK
jgi:branched-chain amino acid transport system substrate-binding protein